MRGSERGHDHLILDFMTLACVTHAAMDDAEHDRHKHQGCHNSEYKTTDHRAAKWRILLAALPQPEGHRRHAYDHGERSHDHRPAADETCSKCRAHRVAERLEALACKADDQHAVGGGDTHAHDG